MAVRVARDGSITLEEFLRWPRIGRRPCLEYIDGEVAAKPSAGGARRGLLLCELAGFVDGFARPRCLGRALLAPRFTFDRLSIVPDLAFVRRERFLFDERGEFASIRPGPPDLHIEVMSPGKRR